MALSTWFILAVWAGPTFVGISIFAISESGVSAFIQRFVARLWRIIMPVDGPNRRPRPSISVGWTMVWAVYLILLMAFSIILRPYFDIRIPYQIDLIIKYIGAIILMCIGICALCLAAQRVADPPLHHWSTDKWLVTLALFWGLFPPMWFFTEYFAIDSGAIALQQANPPPANQQDDELRKSALAKMKTYIELGSPVWAAFGVLYAALLSQINPPTTTCAWRAASGDSSSPSGTPPARE
jgi:hypothetical protein